MALRVRLVASFLENHFCTLLHCDLNSILAGSFHFLDAVLFSLKHLLCLCYFPALVFCQEGVDRVFRIDRHVTAFVVALVRWNDTLGRRAMVDGSI